MTARELVVALFRRSKPYPWLKRPLDWGLVQSAGRTQATRYVIASEPLRGLDFMGGTTLKRIEPHRLLALIEEDVGRYPGSKIGNIHQRIGIEIPR
jgi:ATP-dependent DNA helicase RecG